MRKLNPPARLSRFADRLGDDDVLLTRRELAEYLRVGLSTVEAWAAKGYGPKGRKLGGRIIYTLAEARAFARGDAA